MASAVSVPVGVSTSESSSTTRREKRSVRRRDPGREGIGVGRHRKVVFGQLLRLFLSGDNLVLDPVIDVRRYDLAVCEIVFPVIRAAGDNRFGTGGTDTRQLIQFLGARRVYIDQLTRRLGFAGWLVCRARRCRFWWF